MYKTDRPYLIKFKYEMAKVEESIHLEGTVSADALEAELKIPVTKQRFLDELAISRDQAETGKYRDAKTGSKGLREKYQ